MRWRCKWHSLTYAVLQTCSLQAVPPHLLRYLSEQFQSTKLKQDYSSPASHSLAQCYTEPINARTLVDAIVAHDETCSALPTIDIVLMTKKKKKKKGTKLRKGCRTSQLFNNKTTKERSSTQKKLWMRSHKLRKEFSLWCSAITKKSMALSQKFLGKHFFYWKEFTAEYSTL